jgi:hypothetical protein
MCPQKEVRVEQDKIVCVPYSLVLQRQTPHIVETTSQLLTLILYHAS